MKIESLRIPRWATRVLTGAVVAVIAVSLQIAPSEAQQGSIEGRVVDGSDLQPLANTQVFLPAAEMGTLTDSDGSYEITGVSPGRVEVRVELLGYQPSTQTVTVSAGETVTVNFELTVEAISMEEFVVTATGEQRKMEVGNAVSSLDASEQVEVSASGNIAGLLQGNTPGVQISKASGTVGNATNIKVRGNTSINLENTPLVYVDGARINTAARGRSAGGADSDRMLDLSPDEIESIEVVKGPAAATLYGTEAAAGVIRITTKSGAAGEGGDEVRFQAEFGRRTDPNDYPVRAWNPHYELGASYQDTVYTVESLKGPYSGEIFDGGAAQDSFYNPFRTGTNKKLSGSIRGGLEDLRYYASGEWNADEGVWPTNGRDAYSVRGNFTVHPKDNLQVVVSNGYRSSHTDFNYNDGESWGYVGAPLLGTTHQSPVNVGGETTCPRAHAEAVATGGSVASLTESLCNYNRTFIGNNNFYRLETMTNFVDLERYTGSGALTYTPHEFWTNRVTVGYDSYSERGIDMIPNVPLKIRDSPPDRAVTQISAKTLTLEATSEIDVDLTDSWNSQTTVGVQYARELEQGTSAYGISFPPGAQTVGNAATTSGSEVYTEVKTLGYFLQEQIAFKDRLFLTPAVRFDENSAFGENLGAVVYPRFSASWVVSDEEWAPDLFSTLRLRGAWGQSGKQPGSFDAQTMLTSTQVPLPTGETGSGWAPVRPGNPELKPETGSEIEVGFDGTMVGGRLGLEFTYFNQTTKDALVQRPVPPSQGFPQGVWSNVGEVKNVGFEASLDANVLSGAEARWDLRLNVTHTSSEVTKLSEPIAIGGRGLQEHREGYPFGAYFLRPVEFDSNGDVVVREEREFAGQPTPKWNGSVSSTLRLFERFRIYGLFEVVTGQSMVNYTRTYQCSRTFSSCPDQYETGPDGELTDRAKLVSAPEASFQPYHFIDGSGFGRLRTVSLGVELPDEWAGLIGASAADFTVIGENLGTITDYFGVDPEINSQGRTNASKREFFSAGQTRTFTTRLSVTF